MKLQFVVGLCLVVNSAICQNSPFIIEPIPPSPDAAKLAQFELSPVSMYTGTHNFSVPLYELKLDGRSIPISLNYHSGGIRVAEDAGWTGLGWALSTGGSISRTVRGYNDFVNNSEYKGYINQPQSVPTSLSWAGEYYDQDGAIFSGVQDTEPDLFTYNFMGSSGKFVISKKSETDGVAKVLLLKETTDQIKFDEVTQNFIIINDMGFKGHFTVKEYVTTLSGSNDRSDKSACNDGNLDIVAALEKGGRAATAWYLSEISSPSGKVITFTYDVNANGYSNYISISSKSWQEIQSTTSSFYNVFPSVSEFTQSCSRTIIENIYLSSISSEDLYINLIFAKSPRLDIERLDNTIFAYNSWLQLIGGQRVPSESISTVSQPQRLTQILVDFTAFGSAPDYTIDFSQDYFNFESAAQPNRYDLLRLRLDKVKVYDQQYSFRYFDGVPKKSSFGIDYWGYYNGRDGNQTIRPVIMNYPPEPTNPAPFILPGNYYYQSEERKSDIDFGKAGLLRRVTFPTGGYQEFEYGAHEYKLEGLESTPPSGTMGYAASGLHTNESTSFTYKGYYVDGCDGPVILNLSTKCKDFFLGNNCTISSGDVNKVAVELVNSQDQPIHSLHFDFQWALETNKYEKQIVLNPSPGDISLLPGTYSLRAYGIKDDVATKYYGDINIIIPSRCIPTTGSVVVNAEAGGARLDAVSMYDREGRMQLRREYTYNSPDQGGNWSSGKLMNPLMNVSFRRDNIGQWLFTSTSGSSIQNGNAAQGSHIGYSFVREKIVGTGENGSGMTDHYFFNEANYLAPSSQTNELALANVSYEDRNGSLEQSSTFTSAGYPLSTTTNTNIFLQTGHINALMINWVNNINGGKTIGLKSYYKLNRGMVQQPISVSVEYLGEHLTTKRKTFYNSRGQVVRTQILNESDVVIIDNELKYPLDYTNPSATLTSMISRNLLGVMIENTTVRNNKVVNAAGILYTEITSDLFLPHKRYVHNSDKGIHTPSTDGTVFDGGYEEDGKITRYDGRGNILESLDRSGIITSYIYGYNQNYLVAKVVGATRAQIESLLGTGYHSGVGGVTDAVLTTLKGSFPADQITVFNYYPGVGVSDVIDLNGRKTSFDYDAIGRLLGIKDNDGNIVKTFEYRYVSQ